MFANFKNSWSTRIMKNTGFSVKEKLVAKYLEKDQKKIQPKSSDINVLKSKLQESESKEFKKNITTLSTLILALAIIGIYLSF